MIISTRPITGLEARAGLVAFAAMLWTKAGMPVPSVIWNPHIETARINQRKNAVEIVAISERATIPGTVVRKLAGLIAHEFLHARLTTMTPQVKPYLFAIWNGIEDARIERTAIAQGMLGNAAALFAALLADHLGDGIDWQATENFPFSLAIHCRAYPGLACPLPSGLESVWTEARNRVNAAQSSADSLEIAQWVLEQIRQSEEQGKQQGEEQGEDQGDDQGAEQGEEQGNKQHGAGRTSVDAATPADPEAPMKGSIAKVPLSGQVTIEHDETAAGHGHVTASLRRTPRAISDSIPAATKAALRRMLDNSGRSDLDSGRRTGTVDTRAIARAPFDPAIFARRRETAGIDSAIHLLIDISGSMAGQEIKEARNVASAIYRAGIEAQAAVAVTVFDSHPGPLVPFGMGRRGLERIAQIDVEGGTNLSRAVRFAIRSTLARSEARRILIVLTDAAVGEDDARETVDILAAAESLGIQTIGIGIGANVGHAFTRHSRVDTIADLGPQVFAELSRTIRRAA